MKTLTTRPENPGIVDFELRKKGSEFFGDSETFLVRKMQSTLRPRLNCSEAGLIQGGLKVCI